MTAVTPANRRRVVSRRDLRNDALLAGVVFAGAILSGGLSAVAGYYGEQAGDVRWALLYAVALAAPLAMRRRFPVTVAIIVAVAFFLAVSFRIPEVYVGNISLFIAIYTVGAWVDDRRRAMLARVAIIAGMFLWLLITTFIDATQPTDDGLSRVGAFSPYVAFMLIQFLINAAFFGGAYYMGDRAYVSAQERIALEERSAELERERGVTAAQAVALDRVRIARELHDVVAHHVSAMGVQAGAARTVLPRDPVAAERMLVGIEESARTAIDDLHQLLTTLRADESGPDAAASDASTLRLDALDDLIQHARENGLPTAFAVVGDPTPLPDLVQVNLYRIAQEALTNARRHGGAHATADVRLRYGASAVELEVTNTGHVPTATGGGLGLVGMRERAAASGGAIEIGPRPRGGFLVRARIPVGARA